LITSFFFRRPKVGCVAKKEHKMASEEKSFEELLKDAPTTPSGGTASFVGTLAKSSEAGKFVLTLQDGSTVTLETASVKGHAVLGTSVGQTIVRVDVEAGKLPASASGAAGTPSPIFKIPYIDYTAAWLHQPGKPAWLDNVPLGTGFSDRFGPYTWAEVIQDPVGGFGPAQSGGFAPFALATPHQAPAGTLAATTQLHRPFTIAEQTGFPDNQTPPSVDGTFAWRDATPFWHDQPL
jgi:hypothetical protein